MQELNYKITAASLYDPLDNKNSFHKDCVRFFVYKNSAFYENIDTRFKNSTARILFRNVSATARMTLLVECF